MNTKGEAINISEKFKVIDVKAMDSKNRISLGEKIIKLLKNVDAFKVFLGQDGDILLRPMVNIPMREAWIYKNQKVINQIRQGLAEAKEGKTEKVEDLDKFLKNL